jgi:hypothetical protein
VSRFRSVVLAILLAGLFVWSILRLFGVQYSAGGFYPEYSSLRADQHGAKLLFDSLNRLPGVQAERNYLPLEYFNRSQGALLLLGLRLEALNPLFLAQAEKLARRGNRVVMALAYEKTSKDPDLSAKAWKIRLVLDADAKSPHPLSFADLDAWTIREQAGEKVLAAERKFGQGAVLLFAESSEFSNETLVAGRLEPVLTALGSTGSVVFDEQHLGIAESGSVVGLARRLRLAGFACGLGILAALALWKNASAFPPHRQTPVIDHYIGRTSFEGLVTLLQRHLRANQLASACWEQWLKANRHQTPANRLQEAAGIAAAHADRPVDALRGMQTGLQAKGEL